jgi:tetratricopeptide (TPR) repeat protein
MKAKPQALRPRLTLPAMAYLIASVFMTFAEARGVGSGEGDYGYARAVGLKDDKNHAAALAVLTDGLKRAMENNDTRFAFYLEREIFHCHERLGDLTACLQAADRALGHLDTMDAVDAPAMSATTRAYERSLLTGLIAKHHLQGNRMALARQWHDKEGESLRRLYALLGTPELDLKGGVVPRNFIWVNGKPNRSQIARYLWMGSWLLEKEARCAEALANLEAADRYMARLDGNPDKIETDYRYKIRNRRAQLLDFLGYDLEAIALQRETADDELVENHQLSVWIDRLNLQTSLADFYGPSEDGLVTANEACQAIKKLASSDGGRGALRLVHKMTFDLRGDTGVMDELEAIEKQLKESGHELEGEFSEFDQIEIALRLGRTKGLEQRLIASLEKFRDSGNRKGIPSRYHEYGNLLMKLGRPGEAIHMFRETLDLTLSYGWIIHVPDIMIKLAEAHLALGDRKSAAEWLEKASDFIKSHPEIPAHRVASARATMVGLLRKLGRGDEADALRDGTLAYAKKHDVPEHQIRKLSHDEVGGVVVAGNAVAGDIDFQPLRVVSEVAPGETAHARFTLANLTGRHAAGQLGLPADIELISWDAAAGDMRLRTREKPQTNQALPLELGPSEMIRIHLESLDVRHETPREYALAWNRPEAAGRTSHWTVSADDDRSELTVVNANLIRHNPFYLVPLYHAIRARDVASPLRDFRVRSSLPCYVEMIDAATDRVIAVDRRGDGSFREQGDSVYQDENSDLFPDHRFRQAGEVFGMELRVFPADKAAGADVAAECIISIEGLLNGKWETLAENRVLGNITGGSPGFFNLSD